MKYDQTIYLLCDPTKDDNIKLLLNEFCGPRDASKFVPIQPENKDEWGKLRQIQNNYSKKIDDTAGTKFIQKQQCVKVIELDSAA